MDVAKCMASLNQLECFFCKVQLRNSKILFMTLALGKAQLNKIILQR